MKTNVEKLKEMKNCIIIDGKEIQLSEEIVKEIKGKLGLEKECLEWTPKMKEDYHYISSVGGASSKFWYYTRADIYNLEIGNIFKTGEIAQQKLADMNDEIRQTFAKIENYVRNNGDGFVVDWEDDSQVKYYIRYNNLQKNWCKKASSFMEGNNIYMSKEMADKVLKMLNGGN